MDDRRFDSLTKALADGRSRRSVFKGLLGIGGTAIAGGALFGRDAEAARRPTPPSKPVKCPGNQISTEGVCDCPAGLSQCNPGVGPACCNDNVLSGSPGYSECCDNACCEGTCLGEELCCPTNNRPGGQPPTHQICTLEDGWQCCPVGLVCCGIDGCCETLCSEDGHCCPPEDVCPSAGDSAYFCCTGNTICCGAGTNANTCIPDTGCCTDADCSDTCQACDLETHLCVARCDLETEICCTSQDGTVACVTGECCIDGEPGCGGDSTCCQGDGRTACVQGDTCGCLCEDEAFCCPIDDVFFTCVDTTIEGRCCTDADCGGPCTVCSTENYSCVPRCDLDVETCCISADGPICVPGDTCNFDACDGCETEADCCFINGEFAGCVDRSVEGACCTASTCDEFNDFDNCLVGACTDFMCEQRSSCLVDQHCCDGDCSDLECEPATQCSDDFDCGGDAVCCVGDCCTPGQSCVTDPNNNSYCA